MTCVYSGWFLVLGLALFVPLAAALRPGGFAALRQFANENKGQIARVVGFWGLVLAIFFLPYVLANRGATRTYRECLVHSPNASAWVCGPEGSRWYQTIGPHRATVSQECTLFAGFGFLSILAVGVGRVLTARPPERGSSTWALMSASLLAVTLLVLLTLDFGDQISGWWFLRLLPGGGAIRVVGRVYVPVYLFATTAVMLTLAALLDRYRSIVGRGLIYCVMAFAVFEQTGYETKSFDKATFYPLADACAHLSQGRGFRLRDGEVWGMGFPVQLARDVGGVKGERAGGERLFGPGTGRLRRPRYSLRGTGSRLAAAALSRPRARGGGGRTFAGEGGGPLTPSSAFRIGPIGRIVSVLSVLSVPSVLFFLALRFAKPPRRG